MAPSPEATAEDAGGRHGFPWRAAGAILVALSFLAGAGLVVASVTIAAPAEEPLRPPQPDPAAAPPQLLPSPAAPSPAPAPTPDPTGEDVPSVPTGLERSAPTRIRIPRIGVDAPIMRVGVAPDGRMAVPPLEQADRAGWYKLGPSPGEVGTAVVVGHVDSYAIGPAVFFKLGALREGDAISISRADGTRARFRVDGVAAYPKEKFPTDLVYGFSGRAELRLVTCGGAFDSAAREYRDNVIVFASLKE